MSDETLREALLREIDSRISPSEWPDGLADRVLAAIDAALATPPAMREALREHGWFVADVNTGGWVESSEWVPVVRAALVAPAPTVDAAAREGGTHAPVQYDAGCERHGGTTERHCAEDGHPMPAPTVDAAALDVEALARALYAEMQSRRSWDEAPLGMHTSLRTSATAIAREYAALRASAPGDEG